MDGVVLFADDHIYSDNRPEKALFESLRSDFPVLGVQSLELAKKAIQSIGTFSALVLDWQYTSEDNFDDIAKELGTGKITITTAQEEDAAYSFLLSNNFYSLIYVFSEKDIEETYGEKLREKFGNRIIIEKKDEKFTIDRIIEFKTKIIEGIEIWRESNKNLSLPLKWSIAINESMQEIFKEFSEADKDWIFEIYNSSKSDGVDPELFVIELFQLILSESLVQNSELVAALMQEGERNVDQSDTNDKRKSISKLFSRIYFSELKETSPIMTGDICNISDGVYGVLITPECDIKYVRGNPDAEFEILTFGANDMNSFVSHKFTFNRGTQNYLDLGGNKRDNLRKLFNQEDPTSHFLPSFPSLSLECKEAVYISFRKSTKRIKSEDLLGLTRNYKLNSPFIQQLRQRYLAYVGRVGTSAIPNQMRDWNFM